jgi:hypothetical protein
MKRIFRTLLAMGILAVVAFLPRPALAAFSDTKGHWAEQAIGEMSAKGVIKGYEDGAFRPDAYVSREEAVAMAARLFPAFVEKPFQDSSADYPDIHERWSSQYLEPTVKEGLLTGYSDFTFKPEVPISRLEAATLVLKTRYYDPDFVLKTEIPGGRRPYVIVPTPWHSDDKAIPLSQESGEIWDIYVWGLMNEPFERVKVVDAMQALMDIGIVRGYGDRYGWTNYVTRAEVCVMLQRMLTYAFDEHNGPPTLREVYLSLALDLPLHPVVVSDARAKVAELGAYFKRAYPDEYRRARVIYDTVIRNLGYDYDTAAGAHTPAWAETVTTVMSRGMGVCSGIANVYAAVGQAAGLNVVIVHGPVTWPSCKPGDHAWNQITIGDKVIMCDPTYGLGRGGACFDNIEEWRAKGYDWSGEGFRSVEF